MASPTLEGTLAAYAGIVGSHIVGHFNAAHKENVPIKLNAKNLTEEWSVPNKRKSGDLEKALQQPYGYLYMTDTEYNNELNRKRANIHGGGFDLQGKFTQFISEAFPDSDSAKSTRMAQALYEMVYASGLSDKMANNMIKGGDFGGIKQTSGNKQMRALITLDAIKNAIMATNGKPETNWDIRPTVVDGSPGAVFTTRW